MSNVIFYKDSMDTFECDIKIDGASSSKAKARLVLEFKDTSLLFNGVINDGHVSVKIPKLSDVNESGGHATLEVIADSAYFEAWKSPFELKNKKNVSVNEVKINSSKNTIIVDNISKVTPQEKPTRSNNSVLREGCNYNHETFVKESFDLFSSMSKRDKKLIKEDLRNFIPNNLIEKWGNSVFKDTSTPYAKYCMMRLQNIKGRK